MKKLIIYGTGLVAEVAAFYFGVDTDYQVSAFTNAAEFITADEFQGKPLAPFETIEKTHSPDDYEIFIALGYNQTNQVRQARYFEAKAKGYTCATYISPRAAYYQTPVGDNCFILEHNVIQPFVRIGNNVILWSGNHIGHHSTIRDHCFISSHVVVSALRYRRELFSRGKRHPARQYQVRSFCGRGLGRLVMKDCPERTLVKPAQSTQSIVDRDLI